MTTDVAPLSTLQPNDKAIAQYLGLNPSDPRTHAVLAVCQRYDLDPVLKHVIVIPKGGAYITRDGLLAVAHRSGHLDGIVLEEHGFDPDAAEWYAVVSVYRKDMSHPFRYRGRYPASGSNKQYAPEMAIKSAEAMALRRAFAVTGLPTADEQLPEPEPQPARRVVNTSRLRPAPAPAPEPEPVSAAVFVDDDCVSHEIEDAVEVEDPPTA